MTTDSLKRNVTALSADEPLLHLLEIYHPQMPTRIYVCDDSVDLVAFGKTWLACPFELSLPDDVDRQVAVGNLSVHNIGAHEFEDDDGVSRTFSQWLDEVHGGRDVKVRIIQTLRSDPYIESEMLFDLSNLNVNNERVTGQLLFNQVAKDNHAVAYFFTPERSPGLF